MRRHFVKGIIEKICLKMASCENVENRATIKFCVKLGMTPTQTYEKMTAPNMHYKVSRRLIFKWHKRFRDGRESINDDSRSGRPAVVDSSVVTSVKTSIDEDRRRGIKDLAKAAGTSYGTTWSILHDGLGMSRASARWVPRLLTDMEKARRIQDSEMFLRRVKREGDQFLDRIITTDETWLWLFDPESKQQSSVWKRGSSPPPMKAKVNKCGGKFMFIMFADRHGMILIHCVREGCTVNSAYYSKVKY